MKFNLYFHKIRVEIKPTFILLPTGTSIVLPVGYMDQPTGLLHIYLWRRLCGRQRRRFIQITSSGGYLDNLLRKLCEFWFFENYCTHSFQPEIGTGDPWIWKPMLFHCAKLGPVCQKWGQCSQCWRQGKWNRSKLVPCRPIRCSVTNYRYQSEDTYRPYANTCSIATHIHW